MKSVKFNFIMNMIKSIMSIVFPLITFPYASRVLLADGIGAANYVNTIVNYFQLFAMLGISTFAISEGAKIRDNRKQLNQFASELLFINLCTMSISYLMLIAVSHLEIFARYRALIVVSSVTIAFTTIGMEWLYNIIENYQYITFRSVLIQFISLILLFLFVKSKEDVLNYVALTAFSSAGSGILNFVHSRKFITISFRHLNIKRILSYLKPIIIIFGISIASTIYGNIDILMIGLLKNDYDVGIYTAATKLNRIITLVVGSLNTVILPRLSYYLKDGDMDRFHVLVRKSVHFILLLTIPASVGMFFLSPELITVLSGKGFWAAITPSRILAANLLFSSMNNFLVYDIFMPFRKEKLPFFAVLAGCILNVLLNVIFIPRISYVGAAFSTVLAEIIVLCICIMFAKQLINLRYVYSCMWHYFIASIPVFLLCFILSKYILYNPIIKCIIITILSAIGYFLILLLLKNEYSKECIHFLKNKIKKQPLSKSEIN